MASQWLDRPVFVTGGSGLLGSRLVTRLCREGAKVVCLLRDWVPETELVASGMIHKVTLVRGDLNDQPLLERALGEYEIEVVFHLGAQTIVGVANRNPISTFESNIRGTWQMLEACHRSPSVKRVIVASSDKAYGDQPILPYREDAPLLGLHPYDASKSCADLISQTYAKSYRLPVNITRCGNLYGGGDLNWNRIVPGTIRSVLRGEAPVIRSDGKFIRDYFYVEDAVSAYLTLAQAAVAPGEAFNFSNERPISVLDLVRTIVGVIGAQGVEPVILNQATNEIRDQFLSAEKAREQLHWKPSFTLEQGLAATVEWYRAALQTAGIQSLAGALAPASLTSLASRQEPA